MNDISLVHARETGQGLENGHGNRSLERLGVMVNDLLEGYVSAT